MGAPWKQWESIHHHGSTKGKPSKHHESPMEARWKHDENRMEMPWKYHGSAMACMMNVSGERHGTAMEAPWKPHWSTMQATWRHPERPVKVPRKRHGSPMEAAEARTRPWKNRGNTVQPARTSHGSPTEAMGAQIPLCMHHTFVEIPGSTMEVCKAPWRYHESPTEGRGAHLACFHGTPVMVPCVLLRWCMRFHATSMVFSWNCQWWSHGPPWYFHAASVFFFYPVRTAVPFWGHPTWNFSVCCPQNWAAVLKGSTKKLKKTSKACTSRVYPPLRRRKFARKISPRLCVLLRFVRYEYCAGATVVLAFFREELPCFLVFRCRAAREHFSPNTPPDRTGRVFGVCLPAVAGGRVIFFVLCCV